MLLLRSYLERKKNHKRISYFRSTRKTIRMHIPQFFSQKEHMKITKKLDKIKLLSKYLRKDWFITLLHFFYSSLFRLKFWLTIVFRASAGGKKISIGILNVFLALKYCFKNSISKLRHFNENSNIYSKIIIFF